jgi:16S rRNA (adenine1518-N6/adenine1519-N6)-dimethyltransferase
MSNLPYSISSQVVIHFLKQNICKEFYCMLQKEMTERLCGTANTKQYNAFSALSQHYTKFESCLEVAPHNFYPQPQVDSIVIKLVRNDSVFEPHYEQFLKHCFQSRRQTLINNLKHFYDITVVAKWLTLNQYPLKVRSEAIQESKLYALYQELYHG